MDLFLEVKKKLEILSLIMGLIHNMESRPLKRAIQKYVEDVLTEEIIKQNPEKGAQLNIKL